MTDVTIAAGGCAPPVIVDDAAGAAIREDAGPRVDQGRNTPAASPPDLGAPELHDRPGAWPRSGSFSLVVQGRPEPKARPRAAVVGGSARIYTPGTTARYEDRVRKTALRDWRGAPLSGVAITLLGVFYLPIADSWPKWRKAAARDGDIVPTGRPDLDNLVKAVLDGLNGTVFLDDSAIAETRIAKRYCDRPRVELVLSWRTIAMRRDDLGRS